MNTTADGNPLLEVEWEACLLKPERNPELEAFAKQSMGVVPPALPYLMTCPWIARAEVLFNYSNGLLMDLEEEHADLAAMAASLDNACRYCYATSRFLLRIQGMPEAQVRKLERRLMDSSGSPEETAVINFTYRMSRADPLLNQADKQGLLDAGFSQQALKELAYVVAYLLFANRVSTIPAISPHGMERLPDRLMTRIMRPLIAHKILRHSRRGQWMDKPADYNGPYAYVVAAYGRSPIAGVMAQVLTEMWGQTALPHRCKALIFAVIAKALGCELSATESRSLLLRTGLDENKLDEILTHLRSPELDTTETLLVPFARQTVWYQPVQIQRQASEIAAKLSTDQFVEAIGVMSLANALCRLSGAVVEH